MEKRYQVFVSSTYADLQEERRNVIQTLMEMDCIPSGMEIFPAVDEDQWEFIKKIISDCDYYILIIGGKYGSITPDGISYTEQEYDFAKSIGLQVLAFLHENPEELPTKNSEKDNELRIKLEAFRKRVSEGRLVKFWNKAEELPGLVALSLPKTIKSYPATGWVRADRISTEDVLNEINELRKRNQELEYQIAQISSQDTRTTIKDLAELTEFIEIKGLYFNESNKKYHAWNYTITWDNLFALVAPYLLENPNDMKVKDILEKSVFDKLGISGNPHIDDQIYQTIKVQFIALGLVKVQYLQTTQGGMALFWSLTSEGKKLLFQSRTIKSEKAST